MATPPTEPTPGRPGSSASEPALPREGSPPASAGLLPVAIAVAAIVGAVLFWWAWKQGAYFGTVFLPGAIILYGLLIVVLASAPLRLRLNPTVYLTVGALVALGALQLLSLAWTSVPDAAPQYAQHTILYAALFVLGLATCSLAAHRMKLTLAVIAVLGAAIGIVATVTLAGGTDLHRFFHFDATFRFPIGYRNAEAAFLMICFWPMAALASAEDLRWQLRSLVAGGATMVLELAVLAQSRGSLPAAAAGLLVFLAVSSRRLRAATFVGLIAVPVLPALPALLDVFQHGSFDRGLLPLTRDAARAIAITALGSVLLAAVCIRGVERRLNLGRQRVQRISWVLGTAAAIGVLVAGSLYVAHRGGPLKFLDQRVSQFRQGGEPNLQGQGARFGTNVGSNRHDFWRVSLDRWEDDPLLGGGAGSFAIVYLQKRESLESPRDPHSVEMLMLAELGLAGLLLFATFVGGAAVCAASARRLGPSGALLAAGALASGAYWLVHASYDWLWNYPGVTGPAIFLLGAAAAPALFEPGARLRAGIRWGAGAVAGVALLIAVPLFLSQRYADRAYHEYPSQTAAALSDLDRAADLNPYDPDPLLAKGLIESRLGRTAAALTAFRKAIDREPDSYAAHFFLARELAPSDRAAARAEVAEALRLNPLDPQARRLGRRLGIQRS